MIINISKDGLDKLPPEQRALYEKFQAQYPQLQNKADTSRQLNTPLAEEMRKKTATAAVSSNSEVDYDSIAKDAAQEVTFSKEKEARKAPAEMKIDPSSSSWRSFMTPEEEETEIEAIAKNKAIRRGELPDNVSQEDIETVREEYYRRKQNATGNPKAPPPRPKKEEPPKFSTAGKEHPVLSKLKATLGMGAQNLPHFLEIGGSTYGMRRVNREELTKASSMATANSRTTAELRGNVECAILAQSIVMIDGIPIEDVFQVSQTKIDLVLEREVSMTVSERRDSAVESLFDFLQETPNELIEALTTYYESEFPPIDLFDKEKVVAYCPEARCQYKRIVSNGEKTFCPNHGRDLVSEFPNPFV